MLFTYTVIGWISTFVFFGRQELPRLSRQSPVMRRRGEVKPEISIIQITV